MAKRFMKNPSKLYEQAVSAIARLLEVEGMDSAERAYAESIQTATMLRFVERLDAIPRKTPHVCTHRLEGWTCPDRHDPPCDSPSIPGQDHLTEWQRNKKTVAITSEPYGLSYRTLKDLIAYCEASRFEADISAESMWFRGRTILVTIKGK